MVSSPYANADFIVCALSLRKCGAILDVPAEPTMRSVVVELVLSGQIVRFLRCVGIGCTAHEIL